MATAVNLTITLDDSGAVTNLDALKAQLQDLGVKMGPVGKQGADAFNGIENSERQAHIAGQLLTRTLGIEIPRALETVIARSQTLGPLLQGLFPVSIAASGGAALIGILSQAYEKLVSLTEAAGGYTEEVKQIQQATAQASQQAFLNPTTLDSVSEHMSQIAQQQAELNDRSLQGISDRYNRLVNESSIMAKIFGLAQIRAGWEVLINNNLDEGIKLDDQRRQILEKQNQLIQQQNEQASQLMSKNNEMGKQGYALAGQKYKDFQSNPNFRAKQVADPEGAAADQESAYLDMQNTIMELTRANSQETMNMRHQVDEDALEGIAKVKQAEFDQLETLDAKRRASLIDETNYQNQRILIAFNAAAKITQIQQQGETYTEDLETKAREAALTGNDKVVADKQDALFKIAQMYANGQLTAEQYERALVAINAAANAQIVANDQAAAQLRVQALQKLTEMSQQWADKMKAAQDEAALAGVPEWKQATAQLQIELARRLETVQQEYDKEHAALEAMVGKDGITQADVASKLVQLDQTTAAQRLAIEQTLQLKIQDANNKMAEQLGNEMETVFNDMGSGKIGQDILNAMEKLFFAILAKWILTCTSMGSVFQQIFGVLTGNTSATMGPGGIFSGIFGSSSTSSNSGGILGSLFGSSSSNSSGVSVPAIAGASSGSSSLFGGLFSPGGILGGTAAASILGTTSASALTGSAAGALTTQSIAAASGGSIGAALGGAATLAAPKIGASLGSLASMSTLSAIAPLALMMLGGKFGGTMGQVGGALGGLGVMVSNMGFMGLSGSATALLSGVLTGAGAGLFGFGLGEQHGGLIGSLGGVGAGALMGLLAGGPIGALIGALAGLVGGIFGGLFGGSQRKKQATAYFNSQLDPAVQKIVSDYESHALDYVTATGELEQLRTQAQQQLDKLKGEGKSVFQNQVTPDIDAAEKKIGTDEAERTRRSGLVFGPPQFHDGGLVNAAMQPYTTKPNEILALLKHGEFVMNPQATKKNLGALQALNSGGKLANGGDVHVHIHTIDAQSFDSWARRGGAKMMSDAVTRYWYKEGGS